MTRQISSLTGRKLCTQLLFSLVELENGLNLTSPTFPKKILPTSSIIGSYLKLNYSLFFGYPNEVRKAEQELDNLRMKESGHVSLYIADFRSLISRIGDWGEKAYIHVYKRGLASRLLDQLASYPDTRYHERQKEKGSHQEKKPPATGSNSSRPPQDSSTRRPHHKKNQKGKQFKASKDKPHSSLLNKDNKLIGSENERRIKEGFCTYCGGKNPIEKCFKRPQNRPGSLRGFPRKQGKAWVGIMMCSMVLTYFLQEHNCAL
ncbi:hypothetical protein O181_020980 [Austropuccinia psidii MF-1]|uniref:Retrotransposon gag domain-containing protein n=1 Tax=Austropuccinia psidii MF-1 TaxID=1389203 RepID=A0A9Q3CDP6_9BASI|nr:hypothetical protein [Austropuccinia psidii MF-1]